MTSKTILVTSLATLFVVSMVMSASADAPTWQHVTSSSVTTKNVNTSILSVTTEDSVPKNTSDLGGFGWFYTSGPDTAFGITTHDLDLDEDGKNDVIDSLQNKNGWHAHNVKLGEAACVTEISDAPTSGISIEGTSVKVNVRNSVLTGSLDTTSDSATGFRITTDESCPVTIIDGAPNGLGLRLQLEPHS